MKKYLYADMIWEEPSAIKYSDDNGLSWSERMIIPIRDFKIDLFEPISYKENTLRFFLECFETHIAQTIKLYIPLSKISCKDHFMKYTESVMLCSEDVFDNPTNSHWVTLPEGDIGIRGIEGGGSVAEELSFVNLSDDTIQATFRTVDGYAGLAISRDGGHNFGDSMYLTYPDGRRVKNSRAANFLWKLSEDRYLYWYQNCGYKGFYTRNPAWVCAAVETNTQEGKELRISQPEVLLYHESGSVGFSYPDIILDKGRYFITETQKTIARVHEIPSKYMDMLFSQFDICKVEQDCLLCDTHDKTITMPDVEPFIRQSNHIGGACQITTNVGYTLEFWLNYQGKEKLFDNLSDTAQGLLIETQDDGSVMVLLRDIREASLIDTRPGLLQAGLHHLCVVIDGASRVVCFVVDGLLEDGGSERIVGWGMLSRSINGIRGRAEAVLSDNIRRFRFYGKALTITECIGNWRAGLK